MAVSTFPCDVIEHMIDFSRDLRSESSIGYTRLYARKLARNEGVEDWIGVLGSMHDVP
jgi:hypothetical protein